MVEIDCQIGMEREQLSSFLLLEDVTHFHLSLKGQSLAVIMDVEVAML